jgi:hypothetical protein
MDMSMVVGMPVAVVVTFVGMAFVFGTGVFRSAWHGICRGLGVVFEGVAGTQ